MTKFILSITFVFLFSFASLSAFAVAQSVPASVKPAFDAKFADAKVISYHEISSEHHIIFQQGNEVKSARFDASGKWIETITTLNAGTVPSKIADYIASKYSNHGHSRRVENASGTTYLVYVGQEKAVRFDADGNMLQEETIDAIDEDALSQIK